ncbi:TPM domain-containing protein [Crenobacter sp. SG2303]|uniref:TPM domain-containing protein n=1 Tax=Crenobacter oryzisoli TaxID=3056844 RepID=A0ABT7XV58_9NEIS|nr:TPM domain-containing protein [Crenobacter sp. SG2303]MDN0077682.1 TPM domain-containing protein [Crenobacter sp. SG2303]
MNRLARIVRHLAMTHWQVRRAFPPRTLHAIEAAIKASELAHVGQIRFAVEGALHSVALWRGQSSRARALEVFSLLRVWDTEQNNGVLIYVLLADRGVEIIADRGIHARVGEPEWRNICRTMEAAFKAGHFEDGAVAGVRATTQCLTTHFPAVRECSNELPDRPVLL